MHTPEDKKILKSMSIADKLKNVQPDELKKQWTFIKDYQYRYTSNNKYPLITRGKDQRLARLKGDMTREARNELYDIVEENGLEWILRNRKEDRSIENYHIHLYN